MRTDCQMKVWKLRSSGTERNNTAIFSSLEGTSVHHITVVMFFGTLFAALRNSPKMLLHYNDISVTMSGPLGSSPVKVIKSWVNPGAHLGTTKC